MGLRYSAIFDAVAVSAAQDVFEIVAPSDAAVIIRSLFLGQTTDVGDAASEALKLQFITGFTTSGSGGSTATPVPLETGFPAAGSVVEANNTTLATTGTTVIKMQRVFQVQMGFEYRPTPEEWIWLSPSQRGVFRLPAPADSLTMSGELIFEEFGG